MLFLVCMKFIEYTEYMIMIDTTKYFDKCIIAECARPFVQYKVVQKK